MTDETKTHPYRSTIKKLPHSKVEIAASIPADEFDARRDEAIRHIAAEAEFPGFRKGHVPEKILLAKLGAGVLLEEMAEIAIARAYPQIVAGHKLDVLGRPSVRITKIASGNPLEFILECAVFPEFTLPDYAAIAKKTPGKEDAVIVTDEEVEKAITELRAMRQKNEGGAANDEPPPIDDAFVKTLGDFASVDDFRTKLRENMLREKERQAKDRRRMAMIEAILNETTIDLPEIIVEEELRRLEDEFTHDIERMGFSMEKYLDAVKKTKEEVLAEMRPDAEKRAKTQLVISKIAEAERLEPDADRLQAETDALRKLYPSAPEERLEGYVRLLLTNQRVFEFLESC